jgi:chromosome segregation ATPase
MLNSKLKYEAEGAKKLREELERLTYENSKYRLIERENSTLKDGVAEIATLKKRIAELENKNMIMAQELERLQFTSKTKDTEIDRYRSIAQENESLKSRVSQLEFSYNSKSEVEISRIKSEYEQKFESLSRSQGNELQSRIQIYEGELERLKSTYKLKNDEGEKMKGRLYELEVTLNRAEVENSNKLKNYELNLSTLKRENEELYSKLKIGGENERKLFEYQNKLAQYEREIERLGLNLKGREDEIIALRAKQRELDTIIQKYEFEVGKSKVGYDQILSNLKL